MMIRNAVASDLPYLYDICNRTGFNGGDASHLLGDRNLLGHLFVAPYVVHSPQWCWVVVADGLPVGYFVATPDTAAFYDWMERSWLAPVRAYYADTASAPASEFENTLKTIVRVGQQTAPVAGEFPAHIHMDLLPAFQRQGIGRSLFALFHERVKSHGVKGTHIGVVNGNPGAMAFYEKQGYRKIRSEDWGIYFGRKGAATD